MITSSWDFGKSENTVKVRSIANEGFDEFDDKSMQLILFESGVPIANGALYFDDGSYHIAHICVVPEERKKYVGDLLVRVLIVKAFNMDAQKIELVCPESLKKFFERYGFAADGKKMVLTRETLILEGKCGHDCSNCINKEACQK